MNSNSLGLGNVKRIVLRYIIPGSVLLFVLWFLFNISLYTFDITPTDTKEESVLTFISGDDKKNNVALFGIYLVPRNTDYIEVSRGDKKTRLSLQNKPIVGVKNERVELKYQNTVTKTGKSGLGCNSVTDKTAFSYQCFSDTSNILLYADHTNNEIDNKLSGVNIEPSNSTPYQNGLLSLHAGDGDESDGSYSAVYTNIETGVVTSQVLPISATSEVRFTPDVGGGTGFSVIDTTTGRVYYFETLGSKSVELKKTVSYNSSKDGVSCSLKNKKLICYYGVTTESNIGASTTKEQDTIRGKRGGTLGEIDIYDFAKKITTTLESGPRPIQKICFANDGRIYTLSDSLILVSPLGLVNNQRVNFTVAANDADQLVCGNEVIYSANKLLYKLSGIFSHLVFYEPRMRISTLQGYGDNIIFNTFLDTNDSDDISHTYTLNSSTKANSPRPEEILPYTTNSSDLFLEIDYNNDTIFIKPVISVVSDREKNETIIDQNLLSITKKEIEQRLKDDGLLSKYKIVYVF